MMRKLVDSILINAPPASVWDWLEHLASNYQQWHPDHVSADWESGEPNQVGSVLLAVEDLGGVREELRFELTSIDAPRRLEYRMRGPISVLLPGGAFAVEAHDNGSRFTATIAYRFGFLTKLLFKRRVAALERHMREEGENLKRIIEAKTAV